jgi:hypothetical protein
VTSHRKFFGTTSTEFSIKSLEITSGVSSLPWSNAVVTFDAFVSGGSVQFDHDRVLKAREICDVIRSVLVSP